MKLNVAKLNDSDKANIDYWLSLSTLEDSIETALRNIDCTRTFPNGMRLVQTIDYKYSVFLAEAFYLIDKVEDAEKKQELIDKVHKIHEDNLKFEEEVPPVIYTKGIKGKSKPKQKEDKPKVSALKRKLEARALKLGNLKFSIKPKDV